MSKILLAIQYANVIIFKDSVYTFEINKVLGMRLTHVMYSRSGAEKYAMEMDS